MIKSMTGYGRGEQVVDGFHVIVELKSVNHRYFEYSSRLPYAYGFLDEKLKAFLQSRINRGKVDASVWIDTEGVTDSTVKVNFGLAESYVEALRSLSERFGLRDDISATALARYPDILTVSKAATDEDAVWAAVQVAAQAALDRFSEMREREGAKLRDDVLSRASVIEEAVGVIEEKSPETVRLHMEKVEARMRELLSGAAVEEQRLLTEAAVFADKIAVAEETVRLRSHIDQLRQMLSGDEAVGRKLDFLVQEMNRETNTIGSKAQDVEIARIVVDVKAEIEKIREQIQNIE
ncbi:MAG: YicC family protein [Clostridia bacterium]|nr:YicC family protein [Clostridia bacterium]